MNNYRERKIQCDPRFGHLPDGSLQTCTLTLFDPLKCNFAENKYNIEYGPVII